MLRSRKTPFSLSRVAALAAAFVLFSSLPVFAATYDVGAGQSYTSLKSLFNSGVLAGGDSIVLHNNDSSLPPRNLDSATVSSLSISGAGGVMTISPNSSSPAPTFGGLLNIGLAPVALKLNRLILSNGKVIGITNTDSSGWGGFIKTDSDLDLSGGAVTFTGNSAIGGDAVLLNARSDVSGLGGALVVGEDMTSTGGPYTFTGNRATGGDAVGENSYSGNSGLGGAIFVISDMASTSGAYTFTGNSATGGDALGKSGDTSESGLGGALVVGENMTSTGGSFTFTGNSATGGDARGQDSGSAKSGRGGALVVGEDMTSTGGSFTFTGNSATGGDAVGENSESSASAWGGGLWVGGDLTTTDGAYTFTDNSAAGGDAVGKNSYSYESARGGALYVDRSMTSTGGSFTFTGNSATGGDAVSENSYSYTSGQGGALYVHYDFKTSGGSFTFTGNSATGGDALGKDSDSSTSGQGGALYLYDGDTDLGGSYTFINNRAIGGKATGEGANADNSGLGGAIYTYTNLTITGSALFKDNLAASTNPGDPTGGRGGAILVPAGYDLALAPTAGNDILFKGNLQRDAAGKTTPNSVYFGNHYSAGADDNILFTLAPEAGARVIMWDPIASQPDNLKGASGIVYSNITPLDIVMDGPGLWALGGASAMQSATTFTLNDGTFHLIKRAVLNLSHNTTAQVDLENGVFMPTLTKTSASLIKAGDINIGNAAGTVALHPAGVASLSPGTPYSKLVLSAKNALTANAAGIKLVDNPRIKVGYSQKGNDFYLNVTTRARPTGLGLSGNALDGFIGSGAYLDNLDIAYPVDNWYYSGKLGLSNNQIADTNLLAGDFAADQPLIGKAIYKNNQGILHQRINSWRMAGAVSIRRAESEEVSALNAAPAAGEYGAGYGFDMEKRSRIWALGSRDWADLSSSGDQVGFDADIYGASLGYDLVITRNWLAGISLGYSKANSESKNGGHAELDSDTWFLSLYGAFNYDAWQAEITLTYGDSSNESDTAYKSFGASTSGDFHTKHYGANLTVGYEIPLTERISMTPFTGVLYYHGAQDSYTESQNSGGFMPLARSIDSADYDSLEVPLGLRFDGTWELGPNSSITPSLSFAYAHEFLDEGGQIKARLTDGSDTWTADSVNPGRDALLVDAGINVNINENVELGAGYALELRNDYMDNQVRLNFGVKF